jgi:hypothetical protein
MNKWVINFIWILFAYAGCGSVINPEPPANKSNYGADCGSARVLCKLDPEGRQVCFVQLGCIRDEGWDTLNQVRFWRQIMRMSPDSALVSIAATRQVLQRIRMRDYSLMDEWGKDSFKHLLRQKYSLDSTEKIYITSGKNWFYNPYVVAPKIKRAIEIFDSLGVDPFLAQSVLLIESPVGNLKSEAGAYGHFQLMKSVAKQFGLRVDNRMDEREDFEKSAVAAAKLFREICIPYAASMLKDKGYDFHQRSLWFRLMAMHIYHAGAGTVRGALSVMPTYGNGRELITNLWQTEKGYFKNAAQNYSQLVLASYIEFNHYMMNYALEHQIIPG